MSLEGSIIGDYKIQRKVGAGGMGVVYEGIHVRLEQPVAIKDLSPELASNPEMRRRFIREARIQAQLNHPHVVNVHNLLEHQGHLLLVMEFVEGKTLDKLIQEGGALPYGQAVGITRQVLEAMTFMHSKGVIHRDLKPGNIMITADGRVKVTDFGIAKAIKEEGHTRTGVRLGTLWYMSPEQVKGKPVDARSDLYAMGVTLFQMVTGKLPFFGNSDYEIMRAHTEVPPPNPKKLRKDIPKSLASLILKLLEKNPDKRFQTADEVRAVLDTLKTDLLNSPGETRTPRKPVGMRITRLGELSPLVWGVMAGLFLLAGGIVAIHWYLNRRPAPIPIVEIPVQERKVTFPPGQVRGGKETRGLPVEKGKEPNITSILGEVKPEVKSPSKEVDETGEDVVTIDLKPEEPKEAPAKTGEATSVHASHMVSSGIKKSVVKSHKGGERRVTPFHTGKEYRSSAQSARPHPRKAKHKVTPIGKKLGYFPPHSAKRSFQNTEKSGRQRNQVEKKKKDEADDFEGAFSHR